jgi:hypothetical protein
MKNALLLSTASIVILAACSSTSSDGRFEPAYPPATVSTHVAGPLAVEGGDVRILAHKGSSFETTIAISPQNPLQSVVGVISTASPRGVDFYTTHDGGFTWSLGERMPVTGSNGRTYAASQGDPVVVADRLGIFHFSMLMASGNPRQYTSVAASRSIDGGLTWSAPIIVAELRVSQNEFDDKQWMAVDDSGGRFDGHVYLLWQRIVYGTTPLQSRMMFARSTDRGLSWSEPVALTTLSSSGQSMVEIGPEGQVYVAYYRYDDGGHVIRTSVDGGETFGAPVRMATLPWIGGTIPNTRSALFKAFPTLLCDRSNSSHRGTLYVVLASATSSTTGQRVGGVAISRSLDGGRTWTSPRMISTPTTGDAIFPHGAIDQRTGDLVIAWMDRRDDPANTVARLYATRSRDGGITFETPRGFTPPFSIDAEWIGDYYGVAGGNGNWIATFSPASGQMSAVRLRFDEEPAPGRRRRGVRP